MTVYSMENALRNMRMRIAVVMAGLAALLVLAGCAGAPRPVVRESFVEFTPEQLREIDAGQQYEYRLQPMDLLKIAFADEKQLSPDPVRILPDGAITVVGLDRMVVAGLTVNQADSLITAAYARQYRNPSISVVVMETLGRRLYVMGEVRNPGMIRMPEGGLGPLAAISLAGGFTEDAEPASAVLVRVTEKGYLAKELDLAHFQDVSSSPLATVQILPYDVIYVPRSRIGNFAYFARSVLTGLVQITRLAADAKYVVGGAGRY